MHYVFVHLTHSPCLNRLFSSHRLGSRISIYLLHFLVVLLSTLLLLSPLLSPLLSLPFEHPLEAAEIYPRTHKNHHKIERHERPKLEKLR